jgi:hypothetical protein
MFFTLIYILLIIEIIKMSYTRSGAIFRTSFGRIPANQQEEFEHLPGSEQSENTSFVTADSMDPPPPYVETGIY